MHVQVVTRINYLFTDVVVCGGGGSTVAPSLYGQPAAPVQQ